MSLSLELHGRGPEPIATATCDVGPFGEQLEIPVRRVAEREVVSHELHCRRSRGRGGNRSAILRGDGSFRGARTGRSGRTAGRNRHKDGHEHRYQSDHWRAVDPSRSSVEPRAALSELLGFPRRSTVKARSQEGGYDVSTRSARMGSADGVSSIRRRPEDHRGVPEPDSLLFEDAAPTRTNPKRRTQAREA